MGKNYQYTTLDRVIAKLYRDLGLEEISETDIIEWSGEALEGIGAITLYEEAVAFIEVKNHQAKLPNGLHAIMQLARNNEWSEGSGVCPRDITTDCSLEIETPVDESSEDLSPVVLDCHGTPITDYELAYYRPYFDLQYEYNGWNGNPMKGQKFSPIRLANHTFFQTIVCPEDKNVYTGSCTDEYTVQGDTLKFSFQEGQVALAYQRQKVDPETGYPMVPDDYSVLTAITMYITMKYMGRLYYNGREGYADKFQKAESDWQWYCKQAGNNAMIPNGIDQYQNLLEGRHRMIPNHNNYYGFFGKMGRRDSTKWKDSDGKNLRATLRGI